MGLFDELFGSKQQTKTYGKGSSSSTESGTSSSTTTEFSPEILALLEQVTKGLGGNLGNTGVDADTLRALSAQLVKTSTDTSAIDAAIGASQSEAERKYNLTEGKQVGQFQRQVGSKGNTFSQLVAGQGEGDLRSQLAEIVANSKVQEQQNAITGLNAAGSLTTQASEVGINEANLPLQQFLAALTALRGGTSTTTGTETKDLSSLFQNQGSGSSESDNGVLGALQGILGLFGS